MTEVIGFCSRPCSPCQMSNVSVAVPGPAAACTIGLTANPERQVAPASNFAQPARNRRPMSGNMGFSFAAFAADGKIGNGPRLPQPQQPRLLWRLQKVLAPHVLYSDVLRLGQPRSVAG